MSMHWTTENKDLSIKKFKSQKAKENIGKYSISMHKNLLSFNSMEEITSRKYKGNFDTYFNFHIPQEYAN